MDAPIRCKRCRSQTSEIKADGFCETCGLIEELTTALRFYAIDDNWQFRLTTLSCGCCSATGEPLAHEDAGDKARAALKLVLKIGGKI